MYIDITSVCTLLRLGSVFCLVSVPYLLHVIFKLAVDQELLQNGLLTRQNGLQTYSLMLNLLHMQR